MIHPTKTIGGHSYYGSGFIAMRGIAANVKPLPVQEYPFEKLDFDESAYPIPVSVDDPGLMLRAEAALLVLACGVKEVWMSEMPENGMRMGSMLAKCPGANVLVGGSYSTVNRKGGRK